MAARLQLKLGIVAEHDRLDDSPDTLVVVEPSVGSVARSKGNLYLLVTSRTSSRHALEATRLAAETIRNEYYYDESAGIRVCLQKAIATANKRLLHQADRLGPQVARGERADRRRRRRRPRQRDVRGDRRARGGLPDPPGTPVDAARPASRARIALEWAGARGLARRGHGRRLPRPDLAQHRRPPRAGRAQGRDGHPPSAVGHGASPPAVQGRRRCRERRCDRLRGDRGSADDAWPHPRPGPAAEPLAGAPDRSPIPLADNVQAAGAAVASAADSARTVAGNAFERTIARLHDLLPRRRPAYRRVTPLASRRETQRRAAIAIIALLVVVGSLAMSVWAFGGRTPQGASARSTPARPRSTRRKRTSRWSPARASIWWPTIATKRCVC